MPRPWETAVPPLLYKYLKPERLDVLIDGRIRFSQRTAFNDDHELQPDIERFGTEEEIARFAAAQGLDFGGLPAGAVIRLLAESPDLQARMLANARRHMQSPDEFGVFCLTERPDSDQMWTGYADHARGFVIAFDTTHDGFDLLKTPGKIGKVAYSDVPYGTLLGTMEIEGAATFFRKRMHYAFEQEWRSIRALYRLDHEPHDLYFSSFDPQSVPEIIIRPGCAVRVELQQIVDTDARYRHVQIIEQRV